MKTGTKTFVRTKNVHWEKYKDKKCGDKNEIGRENMWVEDGYLKKFAGKNIW